MRRTRQKFHDTVEYLHGEIPERERRQTLSAMRGQSLSMCKDEAVDRSLLLTASQHGKSDVESRSPLLGAPSKNAVKMCTLERPAKTEREVVARLSQSHIVKSQMQATGLFASGLNESKTLDNVSALHDLGLISEDDHESSTVIAKLLAEASDMPAKVHKAKEKNQEQARARFGWKTQNKQSMGDISGEESKRTPNTIKAPF